MVVPNGSTVIVQAAVLPPSTVVTVTIAVPAATGVTRPVATVAVRWAVEPPTSMLMELWLRVTPVTATLAGGVAVPPSLGVPPLSPPFVSETTVYTPSAFLTLMETQPFLTAMAFKVVVSLMTKGAVYLTPGPPFAGVLPSIVYYISAPSVLQVIVILVPFVIWPKGGLNTGSATTSAAESLHVVSNKKEKPP
jgi:hypothetical protein